MVAFTLVNTENRGGYYIASDKASMGWRELPHDLAREIERVREKGEEVEEVSVGLDGDWFLRTNARRACKTEYVRKGTISNVEAFAQHMQQAGFCLTEYAMHSFTFVPDPTGYVAVLRKMDGSLTRCAWHNVSEELDRVLEREASKGVRHITVGGNDSFVVILNNGDIRWSRVPESLHLQLDDARRRGRAVLTVSLSLIADDWYFVQFADGSTSFFLPLAWHESINKFTALSMSARCPTMSTHIQAPQFGGSFSPASPYSQQPPVYNNITHVHVNQITQAQQPSTLLKHKAVSTLLGGALKLAVAVLFGGGGFGLGIGS